ncbi:MAG: hypothetical protein ACPG05_05165 [Bdellovibrionales bacterium]
MATLMSDLGWWITAIEIPVLSGLFWLFWRNKGEVDRAIIFIRRDLMEFRLDVAQSYARSTDVRELEGRLTSHLLRIEAKLDTTALKTEALKARKK